MKTLWIGSLLLAAVLTGCKTMGDSMNDESMMDKTMESTEMKAGDMGDMQSMAHARLKVTLQVLAGSTTPLAPVAWAVHTGANPFVEADMTGKLPGLEALAEDGDPSRANEALGMIDGVLEHGVAGIPSGASAAGPATPGSSYSFTIEAGEGAKLSFATMYVQSNDLFFSPGPQGIPLFGHDMAMTGDVTKDVILYDAGTEVNEAPGSGPDQAPRQAMANTGAMEDRMVRPVAEVMDGFTYPSVGSTIRVTISEVS